MSTLTTLRQIRQKIASLEVQEAAIVEKIIKDVKHVKIGVKTYEYEGEKITIETKENSRLDKAILNASFEKWMPINKSNAYTLRKKDYEAMISHGTPNQRKILSTIVSTSDAKPLVKIKE